MRLLSLALLATAAVIAAPSQAALVVDASTIGSTVIVSTTDDVIARYEGASAGLSNDLFLNGRAGVIFNNKTALIGDEVNLGAFAVGTELVFRLVTSQGNTFFTGPASRNPDTRFHAAANLDGGRTFVGFEDLLGGGDKDYNDLVFSVSNTLAQAVPEPATWAMMIAGIGLVGGAMRVRARRVAFA